MKLKTIADTLLDEASSPADLRAALNAFAQLCSDISGVIPDPSFDAWAEDSLLKDGVAISPEAAAHCVSDTQRTVVFIRAAYAAITASQTALYRMAPSRFCTQAAGLSPHYCCHY